MENLWKLVGGPAAGLGEPSEGPCALWALREQLRSPVLFPATRGSILGADPNFALVQTVKCSSDF